MLNGGPSFVGSDWATDKMTADLRRGVVVWAELDPVRGREQAGRRPALVIAHPYLEQADTLAIIVGDHE